MSATVGKAARVLLDTSLWIYHFEQHPQFGEAAGRVLHDLENGRLTAVASELSLLELTVLPLRLGRQDVADDYELLLTNFPHLELVPVSREILLEAAALRAAYGLRTPDAVHLATAIISQVPAVITNDASWNRVKELRIIPLQAWQPSGPTGTR